MVKKNRQFPRPLTNARAMPADVSAGTPVISLAPADVDRVFKQALDLLQRGQTLRADTLLRQVVHARPGHFDALHMLGLLCLKRRDHRGGLGYLQRAANIQDGFAPLHNNMGIAHRELAEPVAALRCYDRALTLQPTYPDALSNRGNVLRDLQRFDEALAAYEASLALRPDHPQAFSNRGLVLQDLGRNDEALASFDRALTLRPEYADAHRHRGGVLESLLRPEEAAAAYRMAVHWDPHHAAAWSDLGGVLDDLHRPSEALAAYDRALALDPRDGEVVSNRAGVLESLQRHEDALAQYQMALALQPARVEVLNHCGRVLAYLGRHAEAADAWRALLATRPSHPYALGAQMASRMQVCDWAEFDASLEAIEAGVARGERVITPFASLAVLASAEAQRRCAATFVADQYPLQPDVLAPPVEALEGRRLRLAYVSSDFHDHATAHLIAGVLERHDRARFEVWGISIGPVVPGPMRNRLRLAFEHFADAGSLSDQAVVQLMRQAGIDVAVDLKGFTRDSRPGIFARRPAPVHVSYLGFPGTMAAPYIDYLIADQTVVPPEFEAHYSECVLRVPGSYQPNDRLRAIDSQTPSRVGSGLPAEGFVFCCFNNIYKITPAVFDRWMALLHAVPGSVLWLLEDRADASAGLRREAVLRGVDPARLVFGPRLPLDQHLARHALADLFLDTAPCNAHTTASDSLWAGLPVLTCLGETFSARVAASLLHAVGLPELVTSDLDAYERLALDLARDPVRLNKLRRRLTVHRDTHALFDTDRTRRYLESAFVSMAERAAAGLAAATFDIG